MILFTTLKDKILNTPKYVMPELLKGFFKEALAENDLVALHILHKISTNLNKKVLCYHNKNGEWTDSLIDFIEASGNTLVVPIELNHTTNPKILSLCAGIIAPGGSDSYPYSPWKERSMLQVIIEETYIGIGNILLNTIKHFTGYSTALPLGAFNISYLDDDSTNHLDMEHAYQNSIDYAELHNKFYFGSCLGNQQLILNHGGYVARTEEEHFDNNQSIRTIKVTPGSRIHYLTMDNYEQNLALNKGYFNNIEFPIRTEHIFGGVVNHIGDLQLGGVSDAGVVEAVTNKWYQIGLQFHAEYLYHPRDKILMYNIIRFYQVENQYLDAISSFMDDIWNNAFINAKCFEETCPVQTGFFRDIFVEAQHYAKLLPHEIDA